ncbi:MAG: uncharacterized protein K0S11_466 [Gammaproteobacteria bacterium]|nr:uncharacterized protein [Gammaproteobacteria bacterium]
MKLKSLVLSLMSGMLLTPCAFAVTNDQQVDELITKINGRTQSLEQQVKDLQQQIRVLKQKQGKLNRKQVVSSKPLQQTQEMSVKSKNSILERYWGGTPVVTSPFLGEHSAFDGSDLIVNMSSINQDLRLLQQWQMLGNELANTGKKFPDSPMIELSGKIEAQAVATKPYVGKKTNDIDLSGLELDVSAGINPWTSGFMSISYDNSPLSTSATRTSNSNLFVNKAFLSLGNLNQFPLYLTAGQFQVPFGQYSSFMVSSPLTVSVGRTKARALLLGYHPKENKGLYGSLFTFKGDSSTENNSGKVNQWGANLAYDFVGQGFKFTLGTSYINNMADAVGMQSNGLTTGFTGFGKNSATEIISDRVPGADVQGKLTMGPVVLLGEYLTATRAFNAADMTYNTQGAKPSAMNFEAAYLFKIADKPSSFALGYGQTGEALALALPKQRYSAVFNYSYWKNTIASLEYRHEIAYGAGDVATGKNNTMDYINMPMLGKKSDALLAQFGIYF